MAEEKTNRVKIVIVTKCRICEKTEDIDAYLEDFNEWRKGEKNIQDCFPYMSPSHRELLLSGICEKCWDEMYKEHEEEESRRRDRKEVKDD